MKKSTPPTAPLDQAPLARLKYFSAKFTDTALLAAFLKGTSTDGMFFQSVFKAETKALTPAAIIRAWRVTGLHPYNRAVVKQRVCDFVGKATVASSPGSHAASMAGRVLDTIEPFEPRKKRKAPARTGVVYTPDEMERRVLETADAKAKAEDIKQQRAGREVEKEGEACS